MGILHCFLTLLKDDRLTDNENTHYGAAPAGAVFQDCTFNFITPSYRDKKPSTNNRVTSVQGDSGFLAEVWSDSVFVSSVCPWLFQCITVLAKQTVSVREADCWKVRPSKINPHIWREWGWGGRGLWAALSLSLSTSELSDTLTHWVIVTHCLGSFLQGQETLSTETQMSVCTGMNTKEL